MLPDRISNPGPLSYESGALPIALRGPADKESAGALKKTCSFIQVEAKVKEFYCAHNHLDKRFL